MREIPNKKLKKNTKTIDREGVSLAKPDLQFMNLRDPPTLTFKVAGTLDVYPMPGLILEVK